MKREIKFRAWNGGKMRENKDALRLLYNNSSDCEIFHTESIFMQFTGLTDKNGKEIYEHDLVKAKRGNTSLGDMNDIYEIVWHDGYACFCYKCVKSDNSYRVGKIAESRSHLFIVTPKITEIIGNIYEHPNLLK